MKNQKEQNKPEAKNPTRVPNQPKQAPVQEPDTKKHAPVVGNEKGSAGPYVLAWLLGVPASLLLMIALLRAVF